MNGPVVGTTWFRSLPEKFQAIMIEEAIKVGDITTQMVIDSEKMFEKKMADEGATIHVVNVKPFRERAESAYAALGMVDLKKEVLKTLGR
jgi:TRAP-type C4-dicarboxylate transport system substrate-binding protein